MSYQNSTRAQEQAQLAAAMRASARIYRERTANLDHLISSDPAPVMPSPSRPRFADSDVEPFIGAYHIGRRL